MPIIKFPPPPLSFLVDKYEQQLKDMCKNISIGRDY